MTTSTRLPIHWIPDHPDTTGWKGRHAFAILHPRTGFESSVVGLIRSWLDYANMHEARCESTIGDDGVLGPAWAAIGRGLRVLLNGDTGRLDCGTLDHIILETLKAEGFDDDWR